MNKFIFGHFQYLYIYDRRIDSILFESVYCLYDDYRVGNYSFNVGVSLDIFPLIVKLL